MNDGGAVRRCALLLLIVAAAPTAAHHSVLGFDGSRAVTLSGVVQQVLWQHPHAYIALERDTDSGASERWLIEVEGPAVLERLGWTKTSIRPGDRVRSAGAPARDGRQVARCDYVERVRPRDPGAAADPGDADSADSADSGDPADPADPGEVGAAGDTGPLRLPCFPPGPAVTQRRSGLDRSTAASGGDR